MSTVTVNGTTTESCRVIDLRSDTFTTPTPEMFKAMADAKLGDDCYNEDPTVKELERIAAELLGKEAAVFTPTGTMSNLLAIMAHCDERSSEAICGDKSHAFNSEQGGAAGVAGVQLHPIENNDDGTFCLKKLQLAIRPASVHLPKTKLVMIEQTHAVCGARVLQLDWIEEVSKICKTNNLMLHMDGARIFNAATYLNVSPARVARDVDSVSFCLSKGLSCAIGSVLVGSKEFIGRAHRYRKVVGAAMRQVGILAAPGIVALNQVVPLLKYDHLRARRIAEALYKLNSKNFLIELEKVETNFFLIKLKTDKILLSQVCARLQKITEEEKLNGVVDDKGNGILVKVGPLGQVNIRVCCYLQIDDEMVDLAIKKLVYVLQEFDRLY